MSDASQMIVLLFAFTINIVCNDHFFSLSLNSHETVLSRSGLLLTSLGRIHQLSNEYISLLLNGTSFEWMKQKKICDENMCNCVWCGEKISIEKYSHSGPLIDSINRQSHVGQWSDSMPCRATSIYIFWFMLISHAQIQIYRKSDSSAILECWYAMTGSTVRLSKTVPSIKTPQEIKTIINLIGFEVRRVTTDH